MKTVYKYKLNFDKDYRCQIMLPPHRTLSVAVQDEDVVIWVELETNHLAPAPDWWRVPITFAAVPTGVEIKEKETKFIGTLLFDNGNYVLHIFEVL